MTQGRFYHLRRRASHRRTWSSRRGLLAEGDEVLLVFQPLGTAPTSRSRKYLNAKKVLFYPFIASRATRPRRSEELS